MSHGMHTSMQIQDVGENVVYRCRKVWWTIYILDRRFSSLIGVPNSLHDEDISAPFPIFPDSQANTAVFALHVKLAQALGMVVKGRQCPIEFWPSSLRPSRCLWC